MKTQKTTQNQPTANTAKMLESFVVRKPWHKPLREANYTTDFGDKGILNILYEMLRHHSFSELQWLGEPSDSHQWGFVSNAYGGVYGPGGESQTICSYARWVSDLLNSSWIANPSRKIATGDALLFFADFSDGTGACKSGVVCISLQETPLSNPELKLSLEDAAWRIERYLKSKDGDFPWFWINPKTEETIFSHNALALLQYLNSCKEEENHEPQM